MNGGRSKRGRRSAFWVRWRERLARSRQAFLVGLLIACGIEVVVDWNATLFEINVLRGRVRDRGQSYVHILGAAVDEALVRRDAAQLAALTEGVFADEEVVFVRLVDAQGATLYERLEPEYGQRFQEERELAFQAFFAKQMQRDLHGVMYDPEGQRQRMQQSRWRDLPQRWNDAVRSVAARFVTPPPPRPGSGRAMYQEALRTPDREREDGVTYAFGTVRQGERTVGAVLVAFSMDRTNESIRNKYLKGLGMVLFFVGLILVQNLSSRQDKLRLLDLAARWAAAKEALKGALPAGPVQAGALWAAGALEQSEEKVDGQLFALAAGAGGLDVLLLDPEGEGIESAALALQVQKAWRARRGQGDVLGDLEALGRLVSEVPLSRPLGLLLAHVDPEGKGVLLGGPLASPRLLQGGREAELPGGAECPATAGLVGPLRRQEFALGPGEALVLASAGLEEPGQQSRLDAAGVADFLSRSAGAQALRAEAIADAAAWARGRSAGLAGRDVQVVVVARTA